VVYYTAYKHNIDHKMTKFQLIIWRESYKCTTDILHITATCFGYLDVAIIRLYTEQ